MKTIIIIQARAGSSRLPGKVLLPLGDSVVLDYVVSRCRLVRQADEVIVATSQLPRDDAIARWCESHQVACFRGSEDDVLSRYLECAGLYRPDYVIRVTADCPFLDYGLAELFIHEMKQKPSDIALVDQELPRGLVVEMIAYEALERIGRLCREPRYREHVTYYAYQHASQFSSTMMRMPADISFPELRLTLDTEDDYRLLRNIADHFQGDKSVASADVVAYLIEHPEVAAMNAQIRANDQELRGL